MTWRGHGMKGSDPKVGTAVKMIDDEGDAYFTVYWSRLKRVDKYEINASVPSVAGIFELYYMDEKKKLNLFQVAKTWYGGLRYALRETTDVALVRDDQMRKLLDEHECYYRYVELSSNPDMMDLLFFLERTYLPGRNKYHHSGRYEKIYVKELSDDKIVTI